MVLLQTSTMYRSVRYKNFIVDYVSGHSLFSHSIPWSPYWTFQLNFVKILSITLWHEETNTGLQISQNINFHEVDVFPEIFDIKNWDNFVKGLKHEIRYYRIQIYYKFYYYFSMRYINFRKTLNNYSNIPLNNHGRCRFLKWFSGESIIF